MFKPEAIAGTTDAAINPDEEENFLIPETGDKESHKEDKSRKSVEEIIAFRREQSVGSRLAERITGLRPEDPAIVERLVEDHKIIRSKYGLPLEARGMPNEYEIFLRNYAEKLGVVVRPTSDCGTFFSDNSMASGVYIESEKQIGVDIDKETIDTHAESIHIFEHELIHALQHRYFPAMPVELMEYEAYIAGMNIEGLKSSENPVRTIELLFQFLISGSVFHDYDAKSKQVGIEILPEWDDPKFFLKNIDHIDERELEGL